MVRRISHLLLVLALVATAVIFGFLPPRNSVSRVSAVMATPSIAVYWDVRLTARVNSIDWGNVSLGETRSRMVYVHNAGNETFRLTINASGYSPPSGSNYLSFAWICGDKTIDANNTVAVTLALSVSQNARGISSFGFDLTFQENACILADVNGDGIIDMLDAILLSSAFMSTPQESCWNPHADLNSDSIVDIIDALILSNNFSF